jgi:CDP-diacylglycerol--serine O-phosphatidyltransferase
VRRPQTTAAGRQRRVLPLRALVPNAITVLALCVGLTGVRFAVAGDWERAIAAIVIAGLLDALDGRIARLLHGTTRFGAELDSLSDVIAFGVSPAVIIYLWSLQSLPSYGWTFALAHAVCCALRLARFNAALDLDEQPHKRAGYLTGVPSPVGAGLALSPLYLTLWLEIDIAREPVVVAPVVALTAFLMVSNLPTFSWKVVRVRPGWRLAALAAVGLFAGALLTAPWAVLSLLSLAYFLSIPAGLFSYARYRRRSRGADDASA